MHLDQFSNRNKLLAEMSAGDFALLMPELSLVQFAQGELLVFPDRPIKYSWFIGQGIASMVSTCHDGRESQAAIIGCEGMVDLATVLGAHQPSLECNVQMAGYGYRMPAHKLIVACSASETLRSTLTLFAYGIVTQIAGTAMANASFSIERRLARWLLMCVDRLTRDEIAVTHETLSRMLNVRRAGVTLAIQSLERDGFLKAQRGLIRITDRLGLEHFANDTSTAVLSLRPIGDDDPLGSSTACLHAIAIPEL